MKNRIPFLFVSIAVLVMSTSAFGEVLGKTSFQFFTNQSGTSVVLPVDGATQVRVGIRVTCAQGFTGASFDINGKSDFVNETLIGTYGVKDGTDSSTTVLIETPPDYLRVVARGNGFAGKYINVEFTIWGSKLFEPATAEISSGGSKVGTTSITSSMFDLAGFRDIRVSYDAVRASGPNSIKAPTVTVIGVFNGVDIPIESIPTTGDSQRGGSIMLSTPPNNIKLKFTNNETGTGSEIQVRWYIWGIRKKVLHP